MTNKLPKFIVLNSVVSGDYVSFINHGDLRGYVQCMEPSVFGTYTKIQVELSKTNPNHVHLRFCSSNKYWARIARVYDDVPWILASSDKPEEDTSKPECTLFEPYFQDNHIFFTHVQTGGTVGNYRDQHDRLYISDNAKSFTPASTFRYADFDALVKLPERVAFKGSNGKFLVPYQKGSRSLPYLQFSSSDGNTKSAAYNIHVHPDGHVRVKSEGYGKFWRNSGNWISGDSTDDNAEALFWPVKVNDHTIALRSRSNGEFVQNLSIEGKENCLNAAVSTIIDEAKLVVEELVLERSIYNVWYRMEDARIYDEKPFVAGIAAASNESDQESILSVRVAYDDTKSYSFSNSLSIAVGVEVTINAGLPGIVGGQITVSAELETELEWSREVEETKIAEAIYTITVPARTRAQIQYVGTHGKCSVPFSYTQRDKSSSDGQVVKSHHTDGIFQGVSYYNFDFKGLKLEPL